MGPARRGIFAAADPFRTPAPAAAGLPPRVRAPGATHHDDSATPVWNLNR